MPIRFPCACGKSFTVPDSKAGARAKCSGCGASLTVPRIKAASPVSPAPGPARASAPPAVAAASGAFVEFTGPASGAPPAGAAALPLAEDRDSIPFADLDPVDRAPAPGKCPACGATYPLGVMVCAPCGVLLPGAGAVEAPALRPSAFPGAVPSGPGVGSRAATDRAAGRGREPRDQPILTKKNAEPKGFFRLVLDLYIHPFATMEGLTYHLGSWPMLGKMAVFFFCSLAAVFVSHMPTESIRMSTPSRARALQPSSQIVPDPSFGGEDDPDESAAGDEPGDGLPAGLPAPSDSGPRPDLRGEYRPPAVVKTISYSVVAGVVAVLACVFGLLMNAVFLNLAARLFGIESQFVAMAVVLAFLTGLVNFTELSLLMAVPVIGFELSLYFRFLFLIWRIFLLILALQKVYDVNMYIAWGLSLVSSGLQQFVAIGLAAKLMGMAGG